jgi:hypothetical protein
LRRASRPPTLWHPYEATLRERLKRPLTESAQTSHRPTAPGNDDLAPILDSLQILAKAIMQLAYANFALRWM